MTIRMFDSITPTAARGVASTNGDAVAGYVGGSWPDYAQMERLFPNDDHLSIAVNAGEDATCLDVERGDAVAAQAPEWVRRQHNRGVARPVLYANLSTMPSVEQALTAAGIPRTAFRLWVADYTYTPHIPAGYDACQWTDHAFGRNLDESECLSDFFGLPHEAEPAKATAKPKKHPVKKLKAAIKKPHPLLKIHPKVKAVGITGTLTAALLTVLNAHGVHVTHLTVPETDAITLISAVLAGYLKSSGTKEVVS